MLIIITGVSGVGKTTIGKLFMSTGILGSKYRVLEQHQKVISVDVNLEQLMIVNEPKQSLYL